MLAIVGGMLIDGSGKDPVRDTVIVIDGNIIREVGQKDRIKSLKECEIIDVTGMTLMPGMIDLHVHLCWGESDTISWPHGVLVPLLDQPLIMIGLKGFAHARKTLEMGFTTLRDLGDIGNLGVALRDSINNGLVEGPRIVAAGPYLSATGGHGDSMPPWLTRTDIVTYSADGVDGVLKAVRQQIKMKTDWVKICATGGASINTWDKQQFNNDELRCIIGEAHAKSRPVAAHCVHAKGTLAAVKEGADTIEHGCNLTEEIVDLMIQKGTFLVPTLFAPSALADRGTEYGFTQAAVETCRTILEPHQKSFRMALDAGVKIAFGTDAGYNPAIHGTNAFEFELLVQNGMTPMGAILAATKNAASALRMGDKMGTIEKGKLADIVVVDGDPLEDIKILQDKNKIALVIKDGSTYVNRIKC